MSQRYFERVGYTGDGQPLIADITEAFDLGVPVDSNVIEVGYEDCNVRVETAAGQFLVKAFNSLREPKEIDRYIGVMKAAIEGGVHHPALHTHTNGEVLFTHPSGVSLVVIDFIEGKTFFEFGGAPNSEQLGMVMDEVVKIHGLGIRPPQILDSWAVQHIREMYETVEEFLDIESTELIQDTMDRFDSIEIDWLEHCFIHGDIISTNTLRGSDGKIWILDFAVADIYPKIQELAVIAGNLMQNSKSKDTVEMRVVQAKDAYLAAGGTLNEYERIVLFDYALADIAMKLMGGIRAKFVDGEDEKEADYWIKSSRSSLKEALG